MINAVINVHYPKHKYDTVKLQILHFQFYIIMREI